MCVIADDRAVLGFGGILGGEDTGVTDATHERADRVRLLRSAAHGRDGPQGRRAERCALPLRARRRSGLHPAGPRPRHRHDAGGRRRHAVQAQGRRRAAAEPGPSSRFLRPGREAGRHRSSPRSRCAPRWQALGFAIDGKGATVKVTAPSWRPDVHGAADLVEEVVRIAGLDKVPSAPDAARARRGARGAHRDAAPRAARAARAGGPRPGRGHHLVVHRARAGARASAAAQDALELANPISSEMSSMRPSLLPGLLAAVQRNRNRGFADVALFEVGQAYRGDAPKDQFIAAAGVRAGAARADRRRPPLVGRRRRGRPVRCQGRRDRRCWPASASTPPRRR